MAEYIYFNTVGFVRKPAKSLNWHLSHLSSAGKFHTDRLPRSGCRRKPCTKITRYTVDCDQRLRVDLPNLDIPLSQSYNSYHKLINDYVENNYITRYIIRNSYIYGEEIKTITYTIPVDQLEVTLDDLYEYRAQNHKLGLYEFERVMNITRLVFYTDPSMVIRKYTIYYAEKANDWIKLCDLECDTERTEFVTQQNMRWITIKAVDANLCAIERVEFYGPEPNKIIKAVLFDIKITYREKKPKRDLWERYYLMERDNRARRENRAYCRTCKDDFNQNLAIPKNKKIEYINTDIFEYGDIYLKAHSEKQKMSISYTKSALNYVNQQYNSKLQRAPVLEWRDGYTPLSVSYSYRQLCANHWRVIERNSDDYYYPDDEELAGYMSHTKCDEKQLGRLQVVEIYVQNDEKQRTPADTCYAVRVLTLPLCAGASHPNEPPIDLTTAHSTEFTIADTMDEKNLLLIKDLIPEPSEWECMWHEVYRTSLAKAETYKAFIDSLFVRVHSIKTDVETSTKGADTHYAKKVSKGKRRK